MDFKYRLGSAKTLLIKERQQLPGIFVNHQLWMSVVSLLWPQLVKFFRFLMSSGVN